MGWGVLLGCLASFCGNILAGDVLVVVKPTVSDELLANPGIGWETFNRDAKIDKNLPAWMPSTIEYVRWSWGELEPRPGKINTELINQALKHAHDSGQKLAFRVKCCSTTPGKPFHPDWIKEVGGRELLVDRKDVPVLLPIPDMDDPVVLNHHLDFIKRLGELYDGHPDVERVEIGSIGWWGEWHLTGSKLSKLPSLENRMKVVNAYLAAFKKTPLMMLLNGKECTTYATEHGAGWRADSMGDLGSFSAKFNHMRNGYPTWIQETKVQDVWKTAPIAYEPPNEVSEFVTKGWPLRWIFNYALALHGSSFNGKSGKLPQNDVFQSELTRFLQRLGYRLVLDELSHPAQVRLGGKLEISMKWQNVGSAPCYQPYRLAYRLSNANAYQKVIVSGVTVNHWLSGSIELFNEDFFQQPKDLPPGQIYQVDDSLQLPSDIPPGEYSLSIGVVDESLEKPVVRLGIVGRTQDGWYTLSKVQIL